MLVAGMLDMYVEDCVSLDDLIYHIIQDKLACITHVRGCSQQQLLNLSQLL